MIDGLPVYIPVVFVLTTLFTVGVFLYAVVRAGINSTPGRLLAAFTVLWLIVQAVLAVNGFFQNFATVPPRTFAFGPVPFFLLTVFYLIFCRKFL
ncbi:MAG: hypothetical protein ABI646_09410, partial [Acidobacteriota bacterium]